MTTFESTPLEGEVAQIQDKLRSTLSEIKLGNMLPHELEAQYANIPPNHRLQLVLSQDQYLSLLEQPDIRDFLGAVSSGNGNEFVLDIARKIDPDSYDFKNSSRKLQLTPLEKFGAINRPSPFVRIMSVSNRGYGNTHVQIPPDNITSLKIIKDNPSTPQVS